MSCAYADELRVGLESVRKAAAICQVVQRGITPEVLEKKDNSPITVADFASQAVICHSISESFPSDPVIAEEDSLALHQSENAAFLHQIHQLLQQHYKDASDKEIREWIDRGSTNESCGRLWTLDPIDGTKGFLRRDQYAISLALIEDGELKLGVLACPNLSASCQNGHTLYYAIRGSGAFATDLEPGAETSRIRVTTTSDPCLARFCESFESGHSSHDESAMIARLLQIQRSPVRMDSQAKYAAVASGTADIYLRLPTKTGYFEKIWDHAGGVLIVEEAGGTVTDISGKSLDFSQGRELRRNRGVIVTNGTLHSAVLSAVQSICTGNSR